MEALKIKEHKDVDLEDLIPSDFLPPDAWLQDLGSPQVLGTTSECEETARMLSNGNPAPGSEIFKARARELLMNNEDAFRVVHQEPMVPGVSRPRLVNMRKFWDGLSRVAEFWDSSQDSYVTTHEAEDEHKENRRPGDASEQLGYTNTSTERDRGEGREDHSETLNDSLTVKDHSS